MTTTAAPTRMSVVLLTLIASASSTILEPVLGALFPVSPAVPLCVVLAVGVSCGPFHGILSGLTAGLLLDLMGAGAIGVHVFALSVVGYIAGRISRLMPQWPAIVRVAVASPVVFAMIPAAMLLGKIAGSTPAIAWRPAASFLVMNLLFAVLVTPVLAAIRPRA